MKTVEIVRWNNSVMYLWCVKNGDFKKYFNGKPWVEENEAEYAGPGMITFENQGNIKIYKKMIRYGETDGQINLTYFKKM